DRRALRVRARRALRRVDRGGAQARPGVAGQDGGELPHVRHAAGAPGADPGVMDAGACGIVLAGGAGRRFGAAKQLADLGGRPLVQWALDAAMAAQGLDRVVVVLGARADAVRERLVPGRAEIVVCAEWEEGMAASLRCGDRKSTRLNCSHGKSSYAVFCLKKQI